MSTIEYDGSIPYQPGASLYEEDAFSPATNGQLDQTPFWEQPGFNVDQALEQQFKKILGDDYAQAKLELISTSPPLEQISLQPLINQVPSTSPQPAQELMRRRAKQEQEASVRYRTKKGQQIQTLAQQRILQLEPVAHQASCLGKIEQIDPPFFPEEPMEPCEEIGESLLPRPAIPTPKPSSPP